MTRRTDREIIWRQRKGSKNTEKWLLRRQKRGIKGINVAVMMIMQSC